jgi:hypothetical protein
LVVAEDIVVIMYLTVMIVQNHHVTAVKANKIMPMLNKVSNDVTPNPSEIVDTRRKIVGATFA